VENRLASLADSARAFSSAAMISGFGRRQRCCRSAPHDL
jgi:hypothetical protein